MTTPRRYDDVERVVIGALNEARQLEPAPAPEGVRVSPMVSVLVELTLQAARIADALTTPTMVATIAPDGTETIKAVEVGSGRMGIAFLETVQGAARARVYEVGSGRMVAEIAFLADTGQKRKLARVDVPGEAPQLIPEELARLVLFGAEAGVNYDVEITVRPPVPL
jgi:hypothetical protein